MLSFVPVKKLSTQSTSQPSPRSRSHKWEPMKPAPPVTSTRRRVEYFLEDKGVGGEGLKEGAF